MQLYLHNLIHCHPPTNLLTCRGSATFAVVGRVLGLWTWQLSTPSYLKKRSKGQRMVS